MSPPPGSADAGGARVGFGVGFSVCPPGEARACDLLEAMVAELHSMYGTVDGRVGVALRNEELAPPGGCYLVGRAGEEVVAGGGLRSLDTGPKQHSARHLYLTAGYAEIGNYNANPHASFWGEKELLRRALDPPHEKQ